MINKRFMKYVPVFGFLALAAAFIVIKGMPFITAFVYSMLVVGGVSIGSSAVDVISDMFKLIRKPKFAKLPGEQEGENNEV